MAMEQRVEEVERGVVVRLGGEVDLEQAPRVRDLLLRKVSQHPMVLVDLSAVDYLDSSGLASLVEALQAARKRRSAFGLADLSPASRRVIELGRLDRVFSIYASVEEGLDGSA